MPNFKKYLLLFYVLIVSQSAFATLESISIVTNDDNLNNSVSGLTIRDCVALLAKACDCDVRINNPNAQIILQLPEIIADSASEVSRFAQNVSYPVLKYPNHDYTWVSQRIGDQILVQLQTPSYQGISCGLYGLLQEQLWFSFYHAKEIHVPPLRYWPLTETFYWRAQARFDKKGFHIHTMHPLELTEALLDVDSKTGKEEIKRYIDWLARNQQNYFEFNVLNTIDTARWGAYMQEVVEYAKSRGILMGIEVSLNMKQQKAYQLYKGLNLVGGKKRRYQQIERSLEAICGKANWDVINMEMSGTEFSSGNVKKREALQVFVNQLVTNKYNAKLMGRQHVVQSASMRAGKQSTELKETPSAEAIKLDQQRGVLIHTVMFYSLFDRRAPVYENENFGHLLNLLKKEVTKRETWYHPESAYWINFDNSVPMLLLPYLTARLDDIERLDSAGVKGHVTFSSGWEWGYWLIDWSVARWSWQHEINGAIQPNTPTQYIGDLFKRERVVRLFTEILDLQQSYLKEKELIRYMCPTGVSDELPEPFHMEFQPRPEQTFHWWRYKATYDQVEEFKRKVIRPLQEFAQKSDDLIQKLVNEERQITDTHLRPLFAELIRALKVTSLRARHRSHTLAYLISKREVQWTKGDKAGNVGELDKARQIRQEALQLVQLQEYAYRYSVDLIARERKGHTSYGFGYLFTVSNLHFWIREEEQYRNDNFSPFYRSVWNVPTILGWSK